MDNYCSICKKLSQQLLVLSCSHDPCIDCVAKQFFRQSHHEKDFQFIRNLTNFYTCDLCSQLTKLDQSTLTQLKEYMRKKNQAEKHRKRIHQEKTQNIRRSKSGKPQFQYYPLQQAKTPRQSSTNSSYQNSPNLMKIQDLRESQISDIFDPVQHQQEYYKMKDYTEKTPKQILALCKRHENQEKTFYCFNCYHDICAQCAIHGSHFGHEVQAIKKAAGKLKKIYGQVLCEAQKYDSILASQFKELTETIESFKQWNNKQRLNIKEMFHELYEILTEKQTKLQQQINKAEKEGLDMIQNSFTLSQKLRKDLKQKRRGFMNLLNSNPQQWNIENLESLKRDISEIINSKGSLTYKKERQQFTYLSADIILQAIETIEQLVQTFKLKGVKN